MLRIGSQCSYRLAEPLGPNCTAFRKTNDYSELGMIVTPGDNGQRYYDWQPEAAGQLQYGEDDSCTAEKRREGHCLLQTKESKLSTVEALRAYQDL